MISVEAPIVFAIACELFIPELTIRFWLHVEGEERRTLHKSNLEAAITFSTSLLMLFLRKGLLVMWGPQQVVGPTITLHWNSLICLEFISQCTSRLRHHHRRRGCPSGTLLVMLLDKVNVMIKATV
ncbi:uncharacterized protein LOC132632476 [Lycium barbarum]|uniref:uncharacterized protein LOC132632476 n=1 Tax=Lycium barbarum TaxID=112863 RepID=UPI00293EBAC8|nr:uncharacterized protein LOC132632476 [Lycium barbarum]